MLTKPPVPNIETFSVIMNFRVDLRLKLYSPVVTRHADHGDAVTAPMLRSLANKYCYLVSLNIIVISY